jgi:hypothetical protein
MTYALDGLISSIFLWKACCVGVAADTDTVEELCGAGQRLQQQLGRAKKLTMMVAVPSSDVHQSIMRVARPGPREHGATQGFRAG